MNRVPAETALGLAWIVALVASLAVLFIGEVMGQTPCVLCWFQRAFMFPLAIILASAFGGETAASGAMASLWRLVVAWSPCGTWASTRA